MQTQYKYVNEHTINNINDVTFDIINNVCMENEK